MSSRHDKETYFPLSFNEQMAWLGEEIERIIKTKRKNEVRNSNADGFSYEHKINRMLNIIKEDPKNRAVLREVRQAEKEWWAYVDSEPDALSEDEIFTYWNNYMWAYNAELEAESVSYFLICGYDVCHDEDEWIGIYDSLPKVRRAYREAVQELEKMHKKYDGDNRSDLHKKVMINTFNKTTGKWRYNVPYEILFPCKEEPKYEEYEEEKGYMNIDRDITFSELRCYLSQLDRLSICMLETLMYENYICLKDVPNTYDKYYVYGIGMMESEFYKTVNKCEYAASGKREDLVVANCMEVMLSEKPKSVLIKRDREKMASF